jgi:hypothetical protein
LKNQNRDVRRTTVAVRESARSGPIVESVILPRRAVPRFRGLLDAERKSNGIESQLRARDFAVRYRRRLKRCGEGGI